MPEIDVPQILASLPPRISDVIRPWAASSPDHPALVEKSGAWTYRELDSVVNETAVWLTSLGVRPGDRVMLVLENCRAFIAVLFALSRIDAWPVLVNAHLSAREIDQIREHCGARRVLYTVDVSPHAKEHAVRHKADIITGKNLGPIGVGPLNEGVEPEPLEAEVSERVAALIYTSGTTGMPKGVMLSHRNLLYVAFVSARIREISQADRLFGILPMSHAVGLSVVLLGSLSSGATLFVTPRFDPIMFRTLLEKENLTIALGVPAMFSQFLDYARLRGLKTVTFPGLRIISSSGAPLDPVIKTSVQNLFGLPLYNGYGVTECSPNIAQSRLDEPRTDTSVGRIFPGTDVKFVGAGAEPVADGEVGELWVRGPNVMKGYYRNPEETSAAINPEGWFNTRDLAQLKDGHLFIVGRTKDLIVRFGFNVYPAEVEAVLNSHSAVLRSAVIGRIAKGDEQIVAFIELAPEMHVSAGELAEFAGKNLAPYKRPSQIVFVPELPVTVTGKVIKAKLTELPEYVAVAQ
jgi:long-chain acyl-CoA synthetase